MNTGAMESPAASTDEVRDTLIYARTLLGQEQERTRRAEARGHRHVQMAWQWFAFVQVVLALSIGAGAAGSTLIELALVAAAFQAVAFAAVAVCGYILWSASDDPGITPTSLLEVLMMHGASDPSVDTHATLIESSVTAVRASRSFNRSRSARLGALQTAWLCTMLTGVLELALAIAAVAQTASVVSA